MPRPRRSQTSRGAVPAGLGAAPLGLAWPATRPAKASNSAQQRRRRRPAGSPTSAIGAGRGRQRAAQHEPRLHAPVPLVELERERRRRARPSGPPAGERVPKATAPARAPPDSTVKRTCLPSPIGRGSVRRAAGTSSETAGLPMPNGASARSSSASSSPSSSPATTASTRSTGDQVLGRQQRAAAWPSNAARNASMPIARDRAAGGGAVAAVAQQVLGAQASRPASRSNAGIERPEPVPRVAVERDQHDRAVVALGDPRGDDPDHARMPALAGEHVARSARPARATCASASNRIRVSTWRRSALSASSSLRRSARARSGSSVSSSSTPASARCSRPAALIRGASRKPTVRSSIAAGSRRRPASARAARDARVRASARGPRARGGGSRRERHAVGDRRQRDEVEVGVGRAGVAPGAGEQRGRELVARRPPRRGRRTGSRRARGWTIGASGRTPSARGVWWSVTSTSTPARARARPRRRVIAQSTVMSSAAPRAASRSTVAALSP